MGLIASGSRSQPRSIDPAAYSFGMRSRCPTEDRDVMQSSRPRHPQPTTAARWPSRSTVAPVPKRRARQLVPTRANRRANSRSGGRHERTICCSPTASADSATTAANTSVHPPAGDATPAPWANVLANPHVRHGHVGERQRLHLGRERAQFRLTPWHNDPVGESSGEALYLRDEETGHFWSPTPLPRAAARPT